MTCCFNCLDTGHNLFECTEVKDEARIKANRALGDKQWDLRKKRNPGADTGKGAGGGGRGRGAGGGREGGVMAEGASAVSH